VSDFAGMKVLVVEDEGSIALLIEDMLEELGCEVAASVAHAAAANEVAYTVAADMALLDVNLDGNPVFPVARVLRERGIPVVFSTGYGAGGLPTEFADCPVVGKPFTMEALRAAISAALAQT
jgi:DNA-binding response OmpR family regulator